MTAGRVAALAGAAGGGWRRPSWRRWRLACPVLFPPHPPTHHHHRVRHGPSWPQGRTGRTHAGHTGRLVDMRRTGVEDEIEVALAIARLLVDQTCAR